jgi:hypothetical protein
MRMSRMPFEGKLYDLETVKNVRSSGSCIIFTKVLDSGDLE